MKRRKFLQTSSVFTLPLLLQGMEVSAITNSSLFTAINGDNDRVLVLINLIGGNDGLNTLVPLEDYAKLMGVRSNIVIPQADLLDFEGDNGLHPSMEAIKSMYEDSKVTIVQGVGYPDQNRSHFRSSDIWNSASASDEYLTTGWLGRMLDVNYPGYPAGYPDADCPDPFAITMGFVVSETCQGPSANYSIALNNPEDLIQIDETVEGDPQSGCYGKELAYVKDAIRQSNAYSETVTTSYNAGANIATYSDDNRLAQQLKIIARLISGGSQTKIFICSLGGFDTHANQVVSGATATGQHAVLLKTLSEAVSEFQNDLAALDLEDRVLGMTFSEFGRRIQSNFSLGTDHGSAAPLFLFGKCINAGIIGSNPEIPEVVGKLDGVGMQFDFRDIYGSVLMDWFEVEKDVVKSILHDEFQPVPILQACVSNVDDEEKSEIALKIWPSPTRSDVTLELESKGAHFRIELYDAQGSRLQTLSSQFYSSGVHRIPVNLAQYPAGNYMVRLSNGQSIKTKLIQKI